MGAKLYMIKAVNLLCNDSINPIGIDDLSPCFSWQTESSEAADFQSAYQVEVVATDNKSECVWDSGKIFGGVSIGIRYSGIMLKPRTSYKWRVKQWDKNGEEGVWSDYAVFETGIMGKYRGQWIGYPETDKNRNKRDPHPAPMLRKAFVLNKKTTKARVYICGLGYHVLFVNGEKVTDRVLAPAVAQYNERVYYETLDITN